MGYTSCIRHQTDTRLRLEVLETGVGGEGWEPFIQDVKRVASTITVSGNPATRSLILTAELPSQLVQAWQAIQQAGLVELVREHASKTGSTWYPPLQHWQEITDRLVRDLSGGRLDFRSVLGYTLLGLGVRQSLSAKFLPAGLTLLMYAASFLDKPATIKREES
jgi:hypothetical protein